MAVQLEIPADEHDSAGCLRTHRVQRLTDGTWVFQAGSRRGRAAAQLTPAALNAFMTDPAGWFQSRQMWLKLTDDRRVALVTDPTDQTRHYCLKSAMSCHWWVRLASRLLRVRSHNAWDKATRFIAAGISTPEPVALLTDSSSGRLSEYYLTAAVPSAVSLRDWLSRETRLPSYSGPRHDPVRADRGRLAQQIGDQLRRLHRHGFDHRDLKSSNWLIDPQHRVWIIDLDGVRQWWWLPQRRRVQNLGRLWAAVANSPGVTSTDALRCLKSYFGGDLPHHWKSFWRQIQKRARHKLQRQRKMG